MFSSIFLNAGMFNITAIFALFSIPLGIWDHLIPHVDAAAEYNEHIERECARAAARLYEQWEYERSAREMKEMMDEWCREKGYPIWNEKTRHYENVPEGHSIQAEYSGTCGPPDNGR